jgi:D-alanyl-lipoteichoic acid acyltransferase DltB (MBOAT superfamily)
MEIVSLQFAVFTALVLAAYALLSRRVQNLWLLAASYIFYLTWGWQFAATLAGLTIFNYLLGQRIATTQNARILLWIGIGLNASALLLLKVLIGPYGDSLIATLRLPAVTSTLLLPIGFSFYILQAISYLVDLSRTPKLAAASLADFALYLAYFPKLLSGPIERPSAFFAQLAKERQVNNATFGRGLGLILIGLLRKVVISDQLRLFHPADLFSKPAEFVFSEKLLGLFVFAFILYNDFAGYSAIVRGVSLLFGIDLTVNFKQPFFANSFSDFWNRWHISLSAWLRDYIFFPLRRSMVKASLPQNLTIIFPPMVTMLASGLWHGSYLSMLFWGGLHGLYLVFQEFVLNRLFPKDKDSPLRQTILVAFVFVLTSLAWIPFGASSLGSAFIYFKSFLPPYHFAPLPDFFFFDLGFPLFLSLFIDWQEYRINNVDFFMQWKPALQAGALALVLLLLLLFSVSGTDLSGFVYQGF